MIRVKNWLLLGAFLAASLDSSLWAQQGIRWQPALETAKRVAGQTNRLVLVHFWAEWCQPCAEMERNVFSRPDVTAAVEAGFVPVKVNVDHFPATVRQYGVSIVPTDVVITADGQLVDKLIGLADCTQYVARLNQIAQNRSPQAGIGAGQMAPSAQTERGGYQQPALGSYQASGYQAPAYGAASAPSGYGAAEQPQPSGDRYQDYFNRQSQPQTTSQPQTATPRPAYADQWAASTASTPADPLGQPSPSYQIPASPYRSDSTLSQESAITSPYGRAADSPYQSQNTSPYQSQNTSPYQSQNTSPYQSQNTSPYQSQNTSPYQSQNTSPYQSQNTSPYQSQAASPQPSQAAESYQSQSIAPYRSQAALPYQSAETSPSPEPSLADQLPPGSPPLAMDGFCPVRLAEEERWVRGDVRWGARHEGRTYLFSGPEEQQRFLASPQQYAPVLAGNDVVLAVDQGQMVPGCRDYGAWYQGKVYLFSSEASYWQFEANPQKYVQSLQQGAEGMARRPVGSPSAGSAWQTYGSPYGGRY